MFILHNVRKFKLFLLNLGLMVKINLHIFVS